MSDVSISEITAEIDKRIEFLRSTINERLAVKDRWISDHFDMQEKSDAAQSKMLDERLDMAVASLVRTVQEVNTRIDTTQTLEEVKRESLRNYISEQIQKISNLVEYEIRSREQQFLSHQEIHKIDKDALSEFKESTQSKLDVLQVALDKLAQGQQTYVLRDTFDARLGSMERTVNLLEKTTNEKIDAGDEALRLAINARMDADGSATNQRIDTTVERTSKIEQGIQIMNARNQQSIIALGVLLTLLEVFIRFYN